MAVLHDVSLEMLLPNRPCGQATYATSKFLAMGFRPRHMTPSPPCFSRSLRLLRATP